MTGLVRMENGHVLESATKLVDAACGNDLRNLVLVMRDHAISPLFLSHMEESSPISPHRQVCLNKLHAALANVDQPAIDKLRRSFPDHLRGESLDLALLELATHALYYELDPYAFDTSCSGSRVFEKLPDLSTRMDGDGLLRVSGLDARPGTVMHQGWALHYHPFLRRHFTSHINDSLISTLLRLGAHPSNTVRLAIDREHLRNASDYFEYFERDYWFGPPLSVASLDDPRKVGTTVHGDPESGLGHEYPRLFVDWRMNKEGQKVVQIEELSDYPSANQGGLRLLRYLHAIRDVEKGDFVHCDGAVRAYDEVAYSERKRHEYITGRPLTTHYRKVFRVDGEISTNEWSQVVAQWFRHNHLVLEYLARLT